MRIAVQLMCAGAVAALSCSRQQPAAVPPVRLAIALQAPSSLAILAVENGYFTQEGLEVKATYAVSGVRALESLTRGEVELATTAEVPLVAASFSRSNVRVLTTIASSENENRIVARRDRGIQTMADLRGKKIATQKASAVHFFLHLVLLEHSLSERDLTVVFLPAEQLAGALIGGRVDAISMREPVVTTAMNGLGTNGVVFAGPGVYHRTELVVGGAAWLAANQVVAERFLRGLLRAEKMCREEPARAAAMIASRLQVPPAQLERLWHGTQFRVALDQALLRSLEHEARWMIQENLVATNQIPNYLRFLETAPMKRVHPQAVTVID